MKRWIETIRRSPLADLFFLLLLCVLAYGVLASTLGFYWDDFPMSWISANLGPAGLARYFSTNRPVWGLFYQVTTPLLGTTPWHWQIFALVMRFATAAACWLMVHAAWPQKRELALFTAALFAVYPGFGEQSISLLYSHFFIILTLFLFSLYLHLRALRSPAQAGWSTALALVCSAANLFSMEYFFLLEIVRPALVWAALTPEVPDRRARLRRTLISWLPYLILFLAAGVWRAFFFRYQTTNYQPQVDTGSPLMSLVQLAWTALRDLFAVTVGAWAQVFVLPSSQTLGALTWKMFLVVVVAALVLTALYLLVRRFADEDASRRPALMAISVGSVALVVAGGPFWVTGLKIGLVFPNDRFTLPFMLGVSLILGGLLLLIPGPRAIRAGVLVVLLTFAVGLHFQNASDYRRDWNLQKTFFWQMAWRMPGIQPGTTLFSNDLPMRHYSDNSLTAPLNWIYAPDNHTTEMSYALFWPTVRLGKVELPSMEPDVPISLDYLAASYKGNTSQSVTIVFQPPACLRVVDAEVEMENSMVPLQVRQIAKFSGTQWILPGGQPALPNRFYAPEPSHGWCYYFEKADLARQQGDWETVVKLGDEAFALGDYPNDPMERVPFIEGYAHVGNWERALALSQEMRDITPVMEPILCSLWRRIGSETEATPEQQSAVQSQCTTTRISDQSSPTPSELIVNP